MTYYHRMNNLQLLIDRYGSSPTLGVNEIAEIMRIKPQSVRDKFNKDDLPFPAQKTGDGRRSPIVASIIGVAKWLDG